MPLMKHRRQAAEKAASGEKASAGMTWPQMQKAAAAAGYKGPRNKAAIINFLRLSGYGDQ